MRLIKQTFALAVFLLSAVSLPVASQQTWYGLWNSSMGLEISRTIEGGGVDQYIRLTAQNSKMLVGGQLHGLRFWIYDKTRIQSASVWISTTYPKNSSSTILLQELDVTQMKDYVHDKAPTVVSFTESCDILPAGNAYAFCFVGISMATDSKYDFNLLASTDAGAAYSNFLNGADVSASYGALPLQVLASGPQMKEHEVEAKPFSEQITMKNTEATVDATFTKLGYEPLSSIDYIVSIGGEAQAERHYDLPNTLDEVNIGFNVPATYTTSDRTEQLPMTITVTKWNGKALSADEQAAAEGSIIVLDGAKTKRTIMEEFTGTWCHNCIRGFVGIELLQKEFGDNFIPIAVHGDASDPMMLPDYYNSDFFRNAMKQLGGYPSCVVDRFYYCDPYCGFNTTGAFLTNKIVSDAQQRTSVADIGVVAHFTDDTSTQIAYDVTTQFGYTSNSADYAIVLVLTADGLSGEGREWQQRNGYDDYTGTEAPLLEYVGKGIYITDMVYNHVAVAIAGVDGGLKGSISAPITAGKEQHFHYDMNVAGNELIQDPTRLNAVAMLIDTRDGSLVNAAITPVADATLISKPSADKQTNNAIYDLQGRRVSMPQHHGIYIIGGKKVVR